MQWQRRSASRAARARHPELWKLALPDGGPHWTSAHRCGRRALVALPGLSGRWHGTLLLAGVVVG